MAEEDSAVVVGKLGRDVRRSFRLLTTHAVGREGGRERRKIERKGMEVRQLRGWYIRCWSCLVHKVGCGCPSICTH